MSLYLQLYLLFLVNNGVAILKKKRAYMMENHRDLFARCLAKPLPPPSAYPDTPEGSQRYRTEYSLRRFEIDDATRSAAKCECCGYVGLRNGIFTEFTDDIFPYSYRKRKFVFKRYFSGQHPPGHPNWYYVYLEKRSKRETDEILNNVCSRCIKPMSGSR